MTARQMTTVDAAWLHMDRDTNKLVVNAVLWFDGVLSDEAVRDAVENRLLARYPLFGQRVHDTGSAAWWVDVPRFRPMTHVTREQLAQPADQAALTEHVDALVARPLPENEPLWRIDLIDGYRGGTVLVARLHHCIADGVALFDVLMSLADGAPESEATSGGAPAADAPRPGAGIVDRARHALTSAGKVGAALARLAALPPDRRGVLRAPLDGVKSVHWSDSIPLGPIKATARADGVTINDIVLEAVSTALADYLTTAGDSRGDVRAVVPIDMRPHHTSVSELGNYFGLLFLRLPVSLAGRAERLAAIRRDTQRLKSSAMPWVTLRILRVAGARHRRLIQALITVFSSKASVVITNVRGPQDPVHLGGRRLVGVVAWPPQSGTIGMGVSVISYAGSVVVGIMSDAGTIRHPERLLADLTAALTRPRDA